MKPTDFSVHVTSFLTHYLAAQRNVSPNTIKAYRDVFTLLLRFCRDVQGIALEKLRLEQIRRFVCRSIPGLPGARKKVFTPHTKSTACGPACILPICSGGRDDPYASMSKNPRDPAAETHSPNRQLPFQRR